MTIFKSTISAGLATSAVSRMRNFFYDLRQKVPNLNMKYLLDSLMAGGDLIEVIDMVVVVARGA